MVAVGGPCRRWCCEVCITPPESSRVPPGRRRQLPAAAASSPGLSEQQHSILCPLSTALSLQRWRWWSPTIKSRCSGRRRRPTTPRTPCSGTTRASAARAPGPPPPAAPQSRWAAAAALGGVDGGMPGWGAGAGRLREGRESTSLTAPQLPHTTPWRPRETALLSPLPPPPPPTPPGPPHRAGVPRRQRCSHRPPRRRAQRRQGLEHGARRADCGVAPAPRRHPLLLQLQRHLRARHAHRGRHWRGGQQQARRGGRQLGGLALRVPLHLGRRLRLHLRRHELPHAVPAGGRAHLLQLLGRHRLLL